MCYNLNLDSTTWCDFIDEDEESADLSHLHQSCLLKRIFHTYRESYNRYFSARKDSVLSQKRLTIPNIVKTCLGREYIEGEEIPLTPEQAIKWFEANHVGIEFYNNADNRLLLKYHPEKFHSNIKPNIMRVIYHSEHVERIHELASFEHKCTNMDKEAPKLSDNYSCEPRSSAEKERIRRTQLANSEIKILDIIKNECLKIEEKEKFRMLEIVYNNDIKELLKSLLENGYTPNIETQSGVTINRIMLRNLQYKQCKLNVVIRIPVTTKGDTQYKVENIEEYIDFCKIQNEFESLLINRRNLSTLSPSVQDAFDKYGTKIHYGKVANIDMNKIPMGDVFCLDEVKCYTSCLHDALIFPSYLYLKIGKSPNLIIMLILKSYIW